MSRADGILNLVLKYEWFDKIKSGEKTSEYRNSSIHFNKMFEKGQRNDFKQVRFQKGYSKNPETMMFEIISIERCYGKNDLKVESCWEIKLGRRIK